MSGYPSIPGSRGIDTSIEAAAGIAADVPRLQRLALFAIREAGVQGLTTDELAAKLRFDPCSIQPRTSELRAKKLIADSGQRRRNARAKRVIVWVAPEYVPVLQSEGQANATQR